MKRARETGLDLVLDPVRAEASLWRRTRFEDDAGSRETLFNRYVVLARQVAARHALWRRNGGERRDLEQFAYEALLHAIDRYDPLRGVPFGAFARPRIAGNIADGAARLSEIGTQLSQRRRMQQERLRSLRPTADAPDPLAALADLVVDLALGLMLEGSGMLADADGADPRPSAYEGLAWRQTQVAIAQSLDRLPANEQTVVRQHYQTGLSFTHIADLLRLSPGRISQLHRSAIERLRRWLRHH